METYIAILRGINVGGKNKIQMSDLKGKLGRSGLKNVQTYIQSGNIVFECPVSSPGGVAQEIEDEIRKQYGFQVPVIVLTVSDLADIVSNNPFVTARNEEESKLHVTFLSEKEKKEDLNRVMEISHPPDEIIPGEKAIYLFCPDGYARTKFTNQFFERKLHVTATTRNWKTSIRLLETAKSMQAH